MVDELSQYFFLQCTSTIPNGFSAPELFINAGFFLSSEVNGIHVNGALVNHSEFEVV